MQRSEVDRRAKRYRAKQCVSDYGMHKDALRTVRKTVRFVPLKQEIEALKRKFQDGFQP